MRLSTPTVTALMMIFILMLTASITIHPLASGALAPGPTIVGVWSDSCGSSNITIANGSCGTLTPGTVISVEINVTNAPPISAYDLNLYYDSNYINATTTQVNGTGLAFQKAFKVREEISLGKLRLAVTALGAGQEFTGANGTLAHVFFRIEGTGVSPLALSAGMKTSSTHAQAFTIVSFGDRPIDVATSDGYFTNEPVKLGPIASFTYSPANPKQDDEVRFNATASIDPDISAGSGIEQYIWDFGDGGGGPTASAIISHIFRGSGTGFGFVGNFSIRLTVVDEDDAFQGMMVQRVFIEELPNHNIEVESLLPSKSIVTPGEIVTVTATVRNSGTFEETFNLTVTYGPPTVLLAKNASISIARQTEKQFQLTLDTTGLVPAVYTINATAVIIGFDDITPIDNIKTQTITVTAPQQDPLLYIIVGVIVAAAAIVAVGLLLKRRRRGAEPE